jgi:hypothetical protein
MAPETEHLKGIIEIETFLQELDFLLAELEVVEAAIERIDGKTVKVDFEERGFESLMGQMIAADSMGGFGGGGGGGNIGAVFGNMAGDSTRTVDSLSELNLSMSDLHNALARLVPLIFVVIGALPALIGGLVGLAGAAVAATAALAGIAGFGALGFAMMEGDTIMEGFQEILSQVREDFLDAFTPLAQQLAPLFEDALDGLGLFFQKLANRGDVLREFEQTARSFGGFLLDELPDAIAFLGQVATAFEPLFAAIGDALDGTGEGFMEFMADVLPALVLFGSLLASAIPQILNVSRGFLMVTNALFLLLNAFWEVITIGGLLDEQIGILIGVTLTAVTAILLWNTVMGIASSVTIPALISSMSGVIATLAEYSVAVVLAALETWGLVGALAAAVGIMTLGIGVAAGLATAMGAVHDQFAQFTTGVDEASASVRNFDRTTSRVGTGGPYAPSNTPVRANARGSRGGSGSVVMNVEGDADDETVETQMRNANFRLNKTS